jgi:putative phosphoribosyl transferase
MLRFTDRRDAGRQLAKRLQRFAGRSDVLVVGLPRGGVPVAFEVARALRVGMEILPVRRISAPGRDRITIGAVSVDGTAALENALIDALRIPRAAVETAVQAAAAELAGRGNTAGGSRLFPDVRRKSLIIVDDGLATGSTMTAAVRSLSALKPARLVVASPVGAADVCARLRCLADDCVLALAPFPFGSIADWYSDYGAVSDGEINELLSLSKTSVAPWAIGIGSDAPPFLVWSQPA